MKPLSETAINERLVTVPAWVRYGSQIQRCYEFPSFALAMQFANRVAALAETADHHPDILIQYSKVTLVLTSHDAGGLTERDFRLAAQIDEVEGA